MGFEEYEVDVTLHGKFTIMARSEAEARLILNDWEPEELAERVMRWNEAEADVCY